MREKRRVGEREREEENRSGRGGGERRLHGSSAFLSFTCCFSSKMWGILVLASSPLWPASTG